MRHGTGDPRDGAKWTGDEAAWAGDGAALVARGLGKRFGRRWALRGCDVAIPAGTVTALIGPNGAGKSTRFLRVERQGPLARVVRVGLATEDQPSIGCHRLKAVRVDAPSPVKSVRSWSALSG